MKGRFPISRPVGAARTLIRGRPCMEIVLHLGAHRTGTTTFQHYMRDNVDALARRGIGFWGPLRTRAVVIPGLFPGPRIALGRDLVRRAEGRVRMQLALAHRAETRQLLVSDENIIGTPQHCLRHAAMYPAIGDRLARVGTAFDGQVTRVVLTLRSQELFWSSLAAFVVGRGHNVAGSEALEKIAHSRRTWRDVIMDISCALPEAEILVTPFERAAGQPDKLLATALGSAAPAVKTSRWLNRSPNLPALRKALALRGRNPDELPDGTGRWLPFNTRQSSQLAEHYADDLHWLAAGADGLAQLTEDPTRKRAGSSLPAGDMTKGQRHDKGHPPGHLAHSG